MDDSVYICILYLVFFSAPSFLIGFLITFFSIKSSNRIIRHLGLVYCGLFLIPMIMALGGIVTDRSSEAASLGIVFIVISTVGLFSSLASYAIARAFRSDPQQTTLKV